MPKYLALTRHLKRAMGDSYPITFTEIEAIIGDRLPPSAHKHRAWWSNNAGNSVMTKAWLDAGWYSSNVDMERGRLVFRRRPERVTGFEEERAETMLGDSVEIRLPPAALNILRMKAAVRNKTVEDLASEILVSQAHLSMDERLTMADRIRAGSPRLSDVDVPEMIRQDRDSR